MEIAFDVLQVRFTRADRHKVRGCESVFLAGSNEERDPAVLFGVVELFLEDFFQKLWGPGGRSLEERQGSKLFKRE